MKLLVIAASPSGLLPSSFFSPSTRHTACVCSKTNILPLFYRGWVGSTGWTRGRMNQLRRWVILETAVDELRCQSAFMVNGQPVNFSTRKLINIGSRDRDVPPLTLHYTTLHYTTLHFTALHYTTLHYTTLHYTTHTTLHSTPLILHQSTQSTTHSTHSTAILLHGTTPHHTTTHRTAPHNTTPHHTTPHHILHSTPLHCTPLHSTTLHYTQLHSIDIILSILQTIPLILLPF